MKELYACFSSRLTTPTIRHSEDHFRPREEVFDNVLVPLGSGNVQRATLIIVSTVEIHATECELLDALQVTGLGKVAQLCTGTRLRVATARVEPRSLADEHVADLGMTLTDGINL